MNICKTCEISSWSRKYFSFAILANTFNNRKWSISIFSFSKISKKHFTNRRDTIVHLAHTSRLTLKSFNFACCSTVKAPSSLSPKPVMSLKLLAIASATWKDMKLTSHNLSNGNMTSFLSTFVLCNILRSPAVRSF